jgi:ATPase subunit of ABC transporter with duplicated ATPase domains
MSSLRAQALSFSFDVPLFSEVTFQLLPGWAGLVGANGAGKTTLLRLLTRELSPSSGTLRFEPREARVVWCEQRVETPDELVQSFVWAADGLARRLRGRLRLQADQVERWPTLSPGERKRWQLGAALWSEPDVLLLDEPTNHLDDEGRRLLLEALSEFGGVGVVVSHDRVLLDTLTTATLRLHGGTARLWNAPFSTARELWAREEEELRDAHSEAQRALKKEQRRLDDQRRALESTSKQRSTGVRMRNKYDSDARTLTADGRAENAERAHAAALRRTARRADELGEELSARRVHDDAGAKLFLNYEPCPRKLVLSGRVELPREDHLWVRGRNGAGKTTLLKAARAACTLPPERVLWLPQELSAEDALEDLRRVKELPPGERGRVFQLVHALGVEPEKLLRTSSPSPGEARKLRLAFGLLQQPWLAILDEPTNHLDLPAIERLQNALAEFPGALLFGTHDEQLGEAVSNTQLQL